MYLLHGLVVLMYGLGFFVVVKGIIVATSVRQCRMNAIMVVVAVIAFLVVLSLPGSVNGKECFPLIGSFLPPLIMITLLLLGCVLPLGTISSNGKTWVGWSKRLFRKAVWTRGPVHYTVTLLSPRLFVSGHKRISRSPKYTDHGTEHSLEITMFLDALPTASPRGFAEDFDSAKFILTDSMLKDLAMKHKLTSASSAEQVQKFNEDLSGLCQGLASVDIYAYVFRTVSVETNKTETSYGGRHQIWPRDKSAA